MKDDGAFTVPSTIWSDWRIRPDEILIGRVKEPTTTLRITTRQWRSRDLRPMAQVISTNE